MGLKSVFFCCILLSYVLLSKATKADLDTRLLRRMRGQHVAGPNKPAEEQGEGFESDMTLALHQMKEIADDTGEKRSERRKRSIEDMLWPRGILPYEFDPDFPVDMQTTVMAAMKHWEDNTCVKFWKYTPEVAEELGHNDRVVFVKGDGCSSSVGRVGGAQETSIGKSCNIMGSAAHEIGHSLGYYHEQSRLDRDDHVTINFDNILPSMVDNFRKYGDNVKSAEPYDVGSIMHYGPTFLSRDGESETISAKQRPLTGYMGQRKGLSFLDIKTANRIYKCSDHCQEKPKCLNAGFVNERCRCVCPDGFGGKTCETVAPSSKGCGGILTELAGTFHSQNFPAGYGDRVECNWLIEGPPGSNITVEIQNFETEADEYAPCGYDWLEIRYKGPEIPGLKFCGDKIPKTFHQPYNKLFLQFRSDELYNGFAGFQAKYKIETKKDYEWSEWGVWSPCSSSCGGGNRLRRRKCMKGKCPGLQFQVGVCNSQAC